MDRNPVSRDGGSGVVVDDKPVVIGKHKPAILASYAYFDPQYFEDVQSTTPYREIILDSGAWTAHTCGKKVELAKYMDVVRRVRDADPGRYRGCFSLDVIGDWKASAANTKAMWAAGIEAIPVFHWGEPWDVLKGLAADYPKIGIGGIAKDHASKKMLFAREVFARIWPHKIHGLGFGGAPFLKQLPFDSVDHSSWEVGPAHRMRWSSFDNWQLFNVSITLGRGAGRVDLQHEVKFYMDLEHDARGRWHKILGGGAPTVFLAMEFRGDRESLWRAGLRPKHKLKGGGRYAQPEGVESL